MTQPEGLESCKQKEFLVLLLPNQGDEFESMMEEEKIS
jgi:hypothetical protein